jgi:hypothetical protein
MKQRSIRSRRFVGRLSGVGNYSTVLDCEVGSETMCRGESHSLIDLLADGVVKPDVSSCSEIDYQMK